jgi:hypothetical protein
VFPERAANPTVQFVEFRPDRHDVDVYCDLYSARLPHTQANLAMEAGANDSSSSGHGEAVKAKADPPN